MVPAIKADAVDGHASHRDDCGYWALSTITYRRYGACTYLIWEGVGTEITKRELEASVGTLNVDLNVHDGIWVCGSGRHGCVPIWCCQLKVRSYAAVTF